MDHQEQEALRFFQEHEDQQRREAEGSATFATNIPSSSPMGTAATTTAADDNHITRRPGQVHCNLNFEALNVLKELRVDFNNFAANGMDLRKEMISQGWENYFARLH